ncbi:hypothetical protein PFDG_05138 [Plasmodium falciparum Dd2]|uniref:Uncharacterized protein n=1 Tax=Plasmodium falciparum (isolate Dd2) TaxID=57267 RepID=A0A0L7M9V4_PLAF4|nr:hypothetical protein PFDG_05138 [Plasmodium falciparum Dd2]
MDDSNKENPSYPFRNRSDIYKTNINNYTYHSSDSVKPLSFFMHVNIIPISTNDIEYKR